MTEDYNNNFKFIVINVKVNDLTHNVLFVRLLTSTDEENVSNVKKTFEL